MANPPDVALKALAILQDADRYLTARQGTSMDPAERDGLQRWRADLNASAAKMEAVADSDASSHEPASAMLVELLDLSQRHIQDLHETDSYHFVNVALSALQNTVKLVADTHGAGGGNPIGRPK